MSEEFYEEIILDHNRRPRNFREQANCSCSVGRVNAICGDRVTLFLKVEGNTIQDASFQGEGCAISKASASLMTMKIKGKTVAAAAELSKGFKNMLKNGEVLDAGDLAAISGVRQFPARINCALLAWDALFEALSHAAKSNQDGETLQKISENKSCRPD